MFPIVRRVLILSPHPNLTIIELVMWLAACPCVCGNRLLERLMSPSPNSQVMFASAVSWIGDFFVFWAVIVFFKLRPLCWIYEYACNEHAADGGGGGGQFDVNIPSLSPRGREPLELNIACCVRCFNYSSLHGLSFQSLEVWQCVNVTFPGYIYYEERRAVNALIHMDQSYEIYKAFCKPQKVWNYIGYFPPCCVCVCLYWDVAIVCVRVQTHAPAVLPW